MTLRVGGRNLQVWVFAAGAGRGWALKRAASAGR